MSRMLWLSFFFRSGFYLRIKSTRPLDLSVVSNRPLRHCISRLHAYFRTKSSADLLEYALSLLHRDIRDVLQQWQ